MLNVFLSALNLTTKKQWSIKCLHNFPAICFCCELIFIVFNEQTGGKKHTHAFQTVDDLMYVTVSHIVYMCITLNRPFYGRLLLYYAKSWTSLDLLLCFFYVIR